LDYTGFRFTVSSEGVILFLSCQSVCLLQRFILCLLRESYCFCLVSLSLLQSHKLTYHSTWIHYPDSMQTSLFKVYIYDTQRTKSDWQKSHSHLRSEQKIPFFKWLTTTQVNEEIIFCKVDWFYHLVDQFIGGFSIHLKHIKTTVIMGKAILRLKIFLCG
jgi:hypothetical protein